MYTFKGNFKSEVCDLDLSGVRHAEQGQSFDNLCKVSGNKKKTEMVFFLVDCQGLEPWTP